MMQPDYIEWKYRPNDLIRTAISHGNVEMIEFISTQIKGIHACSFGHYDRVKLSEILQERIARSCFANLYQANRMVHKYPPVVMCLYLAAECKSQNQRIRMIRKINDGNDSCVR